MVGATKLVLGGTDLLGNWGKLDQGNRVRDFVADQSRGERLTSKLLCVCLPDPKDLLGSPSADSEYIIVTNAQLHSPASAFFSPLIGSRGEQEPC